MLIDANNPPDPERDIVEVVRERRRMGLKLLPHQIDQLLEEVDRLRAQTGEM